MSLADGVLSPTADARNEAHGRALLQRRKNGASWFFWVAALSVINSVILMTGGAWSFIFGLGITQVVDGVAMAARPSETGQLPVEALAIDIIIAGVFALFGYGAIRGRTPAYVTGMVLYVLDGVLFVVAGDYLSAGFHAFALWSMWRGLQAQRELLAMARAAHEPGREPIG